MQVMLMRLMSKGEYVIVPKGTKFTGSGKLGLTSSTEYGRFSDLVACVLILVYPKRLDILLTPIFKHQQNIAVYLKIQRVPPF